MFNVKIIGPEQWANSGSMLNAMTVVAGAARLYTVVVYNTTGGTPGTDVYIQVFDSSAPPGNGSTPGTPVMAFRVGGDSQGALDMGIGGRAMRLGICVVVTSGPPSELGAIAIAGQCLIDVGYRKGGTML